MKAGPRKRGALYRFNNPGRYNNELSYLTVFFWGVMIPRSCTSLNCKTLRPIVYLGQGDMRRDDKYINYCLVRETFSIHINLQTDTHLKQSPCLLQCQGLPGARLLSFLSSLCHCVSSRITLATGVLILPVQVNKRVYSTPGVDYCLVSLKEDAVHAGTKA